MATAEANKNYFNFSGGFNSDVSPLNFPPNTSVDEVNFPLRIDGERHRRKGMDYETSYVKASHTSASTDAVMAFNWHNVGNVSTTNFQVMQVGSTLHFYSKDSTSYSNNKKSFTVDLTSRKVSGASDANVKANPIQGVQGRGLFFVVGRYIEPFYITYNSGTDSITLTRIYISARDFKGTEESVGTSDRPTSLTEAHTYDLYNQGWTPARVASFYGSVGAYPSNGDRWEYGVYTNPSSGIETFSASQLDAQNIGNTPASKGHFIHTSIFDTTVSTDQSSVISIASYSYTASTFTITTVEDHGLSTSDSVTIIGNSFSYDDGAGCSPGISDSLDGSHTVTVTGAKTFTISKSLTGYAGWCDQYTSKGYFLGDVISNPNGTTISVRPETVAFFSGRIWYGAIEYSGIGSNIYFSQIATSDSIVGRCYQEADPTAAEISDLVATDGGELTIPEMGKLLIMYPVGSSLVLFADNGLWSVEPGSSGYFTADSYNIRKITDIGCVSARSVVQAEGTLFYWSDNGVYVLQQDKISGYITVANISIGKIETHLQSIPAVNKSVIKGVFDSVSKEIRWLYDTLASNTHSFGNELTFNLQLQAWTKNTIDKTVGPYVIEVVSTLDYVDPSNKIKYFVDVDDTHITFANYNNTNFLDWETYDGTGIDAAAYIITSHELLEDAMRRKFANYIFCYFNRTEDTATADGSGDLNLSPKSSCMMQTRWDWADDTVSGKWATARQVYRFKRYLQPSGAGAYTNGYSVVVTKNKIRGSGKALSIKFYTESGKDCQLLGWAANYIGVTKP